MKIKIIFLCAIFALFTGCEHSHESAFGVNTHLEPLDCDINMQICTKDFNGTKVSFEMMPKPVLAMEKHIIKINGLNANFENPEMIFKGVNMFMGDIVTPLLKGEKGEFKATFMLSFCSSSIMRYRAEIYDNKEPTGYFIEFDIKNNGKH